MPQSWGKPSKAGEVKYKKGKMICDLFHAKKPRLDIPDISIKSIIKNSDLLELPCSLSYNLKAELKTEIDRTCEDTLNLIIDCVEDELIYDLNNPILNIIIYKQQQINITCLLGMNSYSYFTLNENELTFFNNFIQVTKEKIKYTFNKSLNQSGEFWLNCRLYRISARSKAHRIKTLKVLTCEKQQSLAISLLNFKSLGGQAVINVSYGNQTENYALESYCKLFNVTVLKCGLIVDTM